MLQELEKGPKGLEENQLVLESDNDIEININSKGLKKIPKEKPRGNILT